MIYDCFNFFNEFDLLNIRLAELDPIVDRFVLVESTVTFTNKPKPLYFQENKQRYKQYLSKIIHIIVDDCPNVGMPWIIEHHQLAAVSRGLSKAKTTDTILVSCVDEIPHAKKVLAWKNKKGKYKVFQQALCYYYLNYVNYNKEQWLGTQMYLYKDLLTFPDPYVARFTPPDVKIVDGGWHFSYMGGIAQIRKKLESFSHQEYNNRKYNTEEKILRAIQKGEDFLPTGNKFKIMKHDFLPRYVQDNKEKFTHMLISHKDLHSPKNKALLQFYTLKNILRRIVK